MLHAFIPHLVQGCQVMWCKGVRFFCTNVVQTYLSPMH